MRRWLALYALLCSACAVDLTEAWEVKEPRLMGARVEVEGDASNPRPQLGQAFAVRQFLALPGPLATPLAERYSLDLAICLGIKAPSGELTCFGEQELEPQLSVVSDTEVLISGLNLDLTMLDIPPELLGGLNPELLPEALGELDRLVLFGALCVEGRTERVADKSVRDAPPSQLFRCVGNESAAFPDVSTFTLSVLLDRGRPLDRNQNPLFACDPAAATSPCAVGVAREREPEVPGAFVIALPEPDDESAPREVLAWAAQAEGGALPWQGCAAEPGLLQIKAGGKEHKIRVRLDPSDREFYQQEIEVNGEPALRDRREPLLLSHAISTKGGTLDGYDSRLDDAEVDAKAEISFGYTPPKMSDKADELIPENGRLVRFYFTLRDGRGGADFATRELCLVPGENQE